MSPLLGLLLDPFATDPEGSQDLIVLRLVVRSLGALWLGAALLVAVLHQFVALLAEEAEAASREP